MSESMWSTVVCPTDKAVAPCEEPDHQSIEYKIIRDFTTAACINLPVRGEFDPCDPCDPGAARAPVRGERSVTRATLTGAACTPCRYGLWDTNAILISHQCDYLKVSYLSSVRHCIHCSGHHAQVAYLLNINVDSMNYSPLIGAETMNLYTSCLQLNNDGLFFMLNSKIGTLPLEHTVQFVENPTNPSTVSLTG